jgi:hypothetical protein
MKTKGMHLSGPQRSHDDLGKHHGPIEGLRYAVDTLLQAENEKLEKQARARIRLALDALTQEEARRADLCIHDWKGAEGRSRY